MQLGDGAIVVKRAEGYEPVFWPQSGEYINTTFFLTDDAYRRHVLIEMRDEPSSEVAIFTDGLERLALNYGSQTAHAPFFAPMFKALRESRDASELIEPLRAFLDSGPVLERTDDDKTLALATRLGADNAGTDVL